MDGSATLASSPEAPRGGDDDRQAVVARAPTPEGDEALPRGPSRDTTAQMRREAAAWMQEVAEEERARIALELHDDIGQLLTALGLELRAVERSWPPGAREEGHLTGAVQLVTQALDALRRLALQLRPAILDDHGLAAAVEWLADTLCRRAGVTCHVHCALAADTSRPRLDLAAFRIIQEALTNVARHAGARTVEVRVYAAPDRLVVSIRDDGRGVQSGSRGGTLGVVGMRERARACGGRLLVRARAGGGTVVVARLPIPAAAAT